MAIVNKIDTDGTKALLARGELGVDLSGVDTDITYSDLYIGDGTQNLRVGGKQVAVTDTPVLSGNATGAEGTDLVVTIENYDVQTTYSISVLSGTFVQSGNLITWTLPAYTGVVDTYLMQVQGTALGAMPSVTASHQVVVKAVLADQTILFENTTMTATEFPNVVGVDLSSSTLLATTDGATAESYVVQQDVADTDFINATPTVVNKANPYTIEAGATNTSVIVTEPVTDGDPILLNDGATTALQRFDTTGKVTGTGPCTIDITTASLTNAPTIVARDTASIETSIVATGGTEALLPRTSASLVIDNATTPTLITETFNADTRSGRDFQCKVALANLLIVSDGAFNTSTTDSVEPHTSAVGTYGTVSASSNLGTIYTGWKAFDNDFTGTGWLASGDVGQWIQYQYNTAKIINKIILTHGYPNTVDYMCTGFDLKASNTGAFTGEEVALDSITGLSWAASESKTFTFINAINYLYYRIVMTGTPATVGQAGYGEIELIETQTITPEVTKIEIPIQKLGA